MTNRQTGLKYPGFFFSESIFSERKITRDLNHIIKHMTIHTLQTSDNWQILPFVLKRVKTSFYFMSFCVVEAVTNSSEAA